MARAKVTPPVQKGAWIDEVYNNVGNYVNVETYDGITRGGRMTAIRTKTVEFNGHPMELPTEVELNGDPTDTIEINRLKRIDFRPA